MWRMRKGIDWIKEERKRKEGTVRVPIAVVCYMENRVMRIVTS